MDAAVHGGVFLLMALLRYRRQLGRRPRRFYIRPWIRPRQREQYGYYHQLMRELELAEAWGAITLCQCHGAQCPETQDRWSGEGVC